MFDELLRRSQFESNWQKWTKTSRNTLNYLRDDMRNIDRIGYS